MNVVNLCALVCVDEKRKHNINKRGACIGHPTSPLATVDLPAADRTPSFSHSAPLPTVGLPATAPVGEWSPLAALRFSVQLYPSRPATPPKKKNLRYIHSSVLRLRTQVYLLLISRVRSYAGHPGGQCYY